MYYSSFLTPYIASGAHFQVVDVGSMLGDCCLWTLKRTRPLGLCRAFESAAQHPWGNQWGNLGGGLGAKQFL